MGRLLLSYYRESIIQRIRKYTNKIKLIGLDSHKKANVA